MYVLVWYPLSQTEYEPFKFPIYSVVSLVSVFIFIIYYVYIIRIHIIRFCRTEYFVPLDILSVLLCNHILYTIKPDKKWRGKPLNQIKSVNISYGDVVYPIFKGIFMWSFYEILIKRKSNHRTLCHQWRNFGGVSSVSEHPSTPFRLENLSSPNIFQPISILLHLLKISTNCKSVSSVY